MPVDAKPQEGGDVETSLVPSWPEPTKEPTKELEIFDADAPPGTSDAKNAKNDDKKEDTTKPVPFMALFRFAETKDIFVFVLGIVLSIAAAFTMPGIMIVFGDIIDAIAQPINVKELLAPAVRSMLLLGVYGFVTFFLAFFAAGWSASRIANSYREQYLEAVLRQDGTFFDHVEPGSVSLMLSDAAIDIQAGLADKWAAAIQGAAQLLFGFGIALYFGPLLALVLMACLPLLIAVTSAMVFWGSEDGVYGKDAYNLAAATAAETLSNVRTVFSLNAEQAMSEKYDKHLKGCQQAAIRQATRAAFLTGSLFMVIFCMYGLGFWYGAKLIAESTDSAIDQHPAPDELFEGLNSTLYGEHYLRFAGTPQEPGACSPYFEFDELGFISDISEELQVCACGIPWSSVELQNPECGCGFGTSNTGFDVLEGCFSGGRTIMVFFAILMGGFTAGQIGPGMKALLDGRVAAAKMLKVIERKPEIDITKTDGKKRLKSREDVKGQIVFENMHFRYLPKGAAKADGGDGGDPNEGRRVFGGCNLTMNAGETVALVGESGCGKSTIAKLVQRFYDPTEGRILLDGTDLKDIALSDLRANIGVVSQEPLLFDITIEDNIRYGNMDATDAQVIAAAQAANAHDFISRLPDGYDTRVGKKGGKLSGGQKQRVAIARAILRNPAILILDEATSALDNKSEKTVQRALDKLVEDKNVQRTTIVIAHRLSTIRNADKIVVLGSPEGTSTAVTGSVILEEGSHDELMALEKGFYKALVGAGEKSKQSTGGVDTADGNTSELKGPKLISGESEITDDASSVTSMPKSEKTEETEEEEGSVWSKMFGGGAKKTEEEIAKAKEEKLQMQKNKARLWQYTKPEMGWIVFGSCASIIKGSLFPLLSIVFAEMIAVWYNSDTAALRDESLRWSYLFYVFAFLSMATETIQKAVFEKVGERLAHRLRGDLFRGMLRQDVPWFEDEANALGILTARLSTDVKLVRLITGQSVASTLESVSALVTGIVISLTASWEMFLIMLAMVPMLGISQAAQFLALKGSEGSIREVLSKSTDKLHDTVTGIREVQAFSLEKVIADDLEKHIRDIVDPASRTAALLRGVMMGMIQLIEFSVYAFAFWFGGEMIDRGRIEFEDFNTALWAMAFAASGLGQAALFAGDVAKASAAMKSIFETLDHDPSIASEPWEERGKADLKTAQPTLRPLKEEGVSGGTVELAKVNFAYPTRKAAKIFNEIDLTIPSGKVVALVGSSGSGKSTVIQLLERFYDPISYQEEVADEEQEIDLEADKSAVADGVVSLDGADIKESDVRWLRQNMSLVGQEPVLFNDTVFNNIALGKPGCTKREAEEAAKNANAYDFIVKMDGGFDASVGTAGSKVSGGQKQRIAIARALVSNPKILLLDEATSALDNESEKIVQASLDELVQKAGGERTTIIIAHRLSTIKDADLICVLENDGDGSKVCEMGTHDELMALGQKYKALVQAYES